MSTTISHTMNTIGTTKFYTVDYVNYASYDNIRKFMSMVDGLNNSRRKVMKTMLDKNINTEIKVSQLNSKAAEYTEYLHGSMDDVIINMAQDYPGSNNLPLIYPEGNFGSRFIPEASASRYIFTYKQKYTDLIYKKDDTAVLIKQYFEGTEIEPLFYVPTIPMVLINGGGAPSSGFRQKMLPRNENNVIKFLKQKLEDKKLDHTLLIPCYNNTNCEVLQGADNSKWVIKGKIERVSITKVLITEIPVGIPLKEYLNILDELEDNKIITSYKDFSENNIFKFEVQLTSKILKDSSDDEILNMLGLIVKDYEVYTCMDENNSVVVYNNTEEIIDHYIKIKLEYTHKRKVFKLKSLNEDLLLNTSKAYFIMTVIKGDIIVNNKSKDDIIAQLNTFDKIIKIEDSYNYLLNMPIYSLTKEKVQELKTKIADIKTEIAYVISIEPKDMWLNDINELEKALKKK